MNMKNAIVLLSGGMDSAVTLYLAKKEYMCRALIFDYGQKAKTEIGYAKKLAETAGVPYEISNITMPWKGSSLLDSAVSVPDASSGGQDDIPNTYVPARNMIFLSFGVSFAEATGAEAVFIGAHQMDFSNYPDCRDVFFKALQGAIDKGTREGILGKGIKIVTPIIDKRKEEIVRIGSKLGVPFEHTWSCYRDGAAPCGKCESCLFRMNAFEKAGIKEQVLSIKL